MQIKARIDDREGEILRKNQQWTMDVLLVYVEYCISTMSESEIFESKKYEHFRQIKRPLLVIWTIYSCNVNIHRYFVIKIVLTYYEKKIVLVTERILEI